MGDNKKSTLSTNSRNYTQPPRIFIPLFVKITALLILFGLIPMIAFSIITINAYNTQTDPII